MKVFGVEVSGITDDTRSVCAGSLFVAIKGANFDGEAAAADMLGRGAAAVLTQRDLGLGEQQILVPNVRLAYAQAASEFYGRPADKLKLIAVTGTNGKTTVATLIKGILEGNGHKCGFIGTTGYDTGDGMREIPGGLTTPKQDELYRLFAEMAENRLPYCVMEASSQALEQFRIAGISFEIGVFTNLTQDHLDWHGTMENYYQAKKRLFSMCKAALICIDDDWGKRLSRELAEESLPVKTYSIGEVADYYAVNIKTFSDCVSFWLSDESAQKTYPVRFNMPGAFNVANSIAAIAATAMLSERGLDADNAVAALENCKGVRGRCEVIYSGEFTVITDYAHTSDALEKILTCIRSFAQARIICLFGAAGERDSDKRPLMGKIAAKYADYLVITSDNPRFENPQSIIDNVVAGIGIAVPYSAFVKREEAIAFALSEAREGDIILLAGKGHETTQVIGALEEPFDERKIVQEIVRGGVSK
ncbi:MAG: UDP-N-acetylmuramoyl-L-alanyl-D-glutamate--2,6-diaminopimelate ligase [Oscillospiraceae bacterium]|nr:UDP-N-acetylmuramoyl-L-alanyl-D-glutamate--2,6-diaminopimelate ligase [Oscillospiraceae bacterium]